MIVPLVMAALSFRRGCVMSDRTPAYSAALAVALNARTGSLTLHMVDDMRIRAEELLDRDDPMRAAIIGFATSYEEFRRDAYAMEKLGETLQAALSDALSLTAVSRRERRDIDD